MAFDFDHHDYGKDTSTEDNITVAGVKHTNSDDFDGNAATKYLKEKGYFSANDKFYMVDYKPYLDVCPDAHANFGIIILELGQDPEQDDIFCFPFPPKDIEKKPQLVFQQVIGKVGPNGVEEGKPGKLFYVFKGICQATKVADKKYQLKKLWDEFFFDPSKQKGE